MVYIALVLLGLCFGSFVNALVWRLYQQSLPQKKRAAPDTELSIAKGRSMCTHCKHTLAWYDLLPVISWLSLGGKCRYCRRPIGMQYPLVELFMASLVVASYIWWPIDFDTQGKWLFAIWAASLVGLVALMIYDIRWMLLPNKVVFPVTALGALSVAVTMCFSDRPIHSLLLALAALVIAGGLFYGLFQISGGKWIGGGDVKLGFGLGLLLGAPDLALLMLFTASMLGLVVSLPTALFRKAQLSSKIPFGPFLIVATIIVKLFGPAIISWYTVSFIYL